MGLTGVSRTLDMVLPLSLFAQTGGQARRPRAGKAGLMGSRASTPGDSLGERKTRPPSATTGVEGVRRTPGGVPPAASGLPFVGRGVPSLLTTVRRGSTYLRRGGAKIRPRDRRLSTVSKSPKSVAFSNNGKSFTKLSQDSPIAPMSLPFGEWTRTSGERGADIFGSPTTSGGTAVPFADRQATFAAASSPFGGRPRAIVRKGHV
jgi:hypothetical protein